MVDFLNYGRQNFWGHASFIAFPHARSVCVGQYEKKGGIQNDQYIVRIMYISNSSDVGHHWGLVIFILGLIVVDPAHLVRCSALRKLHAAHHFA